MSHSKKTKRGSSLFVESWNAKAKNFINECALCGRRGFSPTILEEGFVHPSPNKTDFEHNAIKAELSAILEPLALDELGRCDICAKNMDK